MGFSPRPIRAGDIGKGSFVLLATALTTTQLMIERLSFYPGNCQFDLAGFDTLSDEDVLCQLRFMKQVMAAASNRRAGLHFGTTSQLLASWPRSIMNEQQLAQGGAS
jgi:hypothetical protein